MFFSDASTRASASTTAAAMSASVSMAPTPPATTEPASACGGPSSPTTLAQPFGSFELRPKGTRCFHSFSIVNDRSELRRTCAWRAAVCFGLGVLRICKRFNTNKFNGLCRAPRPAIRDTLSSCLPVARERVCCLLVLNLVSSTL